MAFQNPYGARLQEFSAFAFNEPESFSQKGKWASFFEARMGKAPVRLILEIGCSNAEFLTGIAADHPETAFIGIDWKFKVLFKGATKVVQGGLKNVALLRGVAEKIPQIFSEGEIDEIWVLFPDPWPKKSQMKHRLLKEPFLLDCHRLLKPGGRLFVKTDHPGYFQWILSLFGKPVPELPHYEAPEPKERSRKARQVWFRRVETDVLPKPSAAVQNAFSLEALSKDYWRDGITPAVAFAGRKTVFESLFVRDELPIYYVELLRR